MIDPLLTAASRWPDALALTDAGTVWTWTQLLHEAAGLASTLDVPRGTRIALLAEDRASTVVAIHAVRLAGGVLVPLHRRLSAPELVSQVTASRTSVLLHDVNHADLASTLGAHTGLRWTLGVDRRGDPHPAGLVDPLEPDAPGVVVHTSGSTASPRGVVLAYGALLASAAAWNTFLESGPMDHWLSTLSMSHVAGLGMALRPLGSGARLTIHPRFDPDEIRSALERADVTLLSLVPTQLARLLDTGGVPAHALRALLLGGGPVSGSLVRRALEEGLPVVPTYGLTEAGSGVTGLPAAEAPLAPGSVGQPLPGVRVRVVHPDGADVAPGEPGEILVGGPTLASGYDGDPAATRARFVDGWLHTRDLGAFDAHGRLWIVDRMDELIVSGGENISPAEVEAVLATHPAIADVAVVGRPDPAWGAVPVAAIALRSGHPAPTIEVLRGFARPQLAGFKLPVAVQVVPTVPRTASGKVVRREVAAMVARGTGGEASAERVSHHITRPDGALVHVEAQGSGPAVLLLHATLSNARELRGLAHELSSTFRVLSADRRSAGASRMPPDDPRGAVDVAIHVDDVLGALDAHVPGQRALVVGHSFGGCVALELAARYPHRVVGAWVFEPPYLPLLPADVAQDLAALGDRVAALARDEGDEAAALAFLDAVHGPGTTARLPAATRARIGAEGRAAVADAALLGLDPDGLGRIVAPVVLGLGSRSDGPYHAIAEALARRVPTLGVERFADLGHSGPVRQPGRVASSIIAFARRLGHVAHEAGAEASG